MKWKPSPRVARRACSDKKKFTTELTENTELRQSKEGEENRISSPSLFYSVISVNSVVKTVLLVPLGVERALAGLVDAFVGVGAEVVALGLDEIGGEAFAAVRVVVSE